MGKPYQVYHVTVHHEICLFTTANQTVSINAAPPLALHPKKTVVFIVEGKDRAIPAVSTCHAKSQLRVEVREPLLFFFLPPFENRLELMAVIAMHLMSCATFVTTGADERNKIRSQFHLAFIYSPCTT